MTQDTTAAARAILGERFPHNDCALLEQQNAPAWRSSLSYATAALSAAEKAGSVGEGWRPIETAPKDGDDYVETIGDKPGSMPMPAIWDVEEQRWYTFNLYHEMLARKYPAKMDEVWRPKFWRPIIRPLAASPTPPIPASETSAMVALETCAIRLGARVDVAKPENGSVTIGVGFAVEIIEAMNRARAALAPGHTDLMVSPESVDAFMEANPLPEETSATPAEGVDLEGVARLVDAPAFEPHVESISGPDHLWEQRRQRARSIATQIAALFPTPPVLPDKLVGLSEKATAGPWEVSTRTDIAWPPGTSIGSYGHGVTYEGKPIMTRVADTFTLSSEAEANAAFIVAAVNYVRSLHKDTPDGK